MSLSISRSPHLDSPSAYPPYDTNENSQELFEKYTPLVEHLFNTEGDLTSRELMKVFNINKDLSERLIVKMMENRLPKE